MSALQGCAAISEACDEPLRGTANDRVRRWLLVEHGARWGTKVPRDTELMSPAVKALLSDVGGRVASGTRLQLVRQPGQVEGAPSEVRVRVVDPVGAPQGYIARTFTALEDLLDEDWTERGVQAAFGAAQMQRGSWSWMTRPLLLICAHGARDACCARQGVGFYLSVRDALDRCGASSTTPEVWQTSHLGGHRFAAVAVSLPDAYVYGRLKPSHGEQLVSALLQHRLPDWSVVRGNASLSPPEQAAELFVRERVGVHAHDGARVLASETPREGWFTVRVQLQDHRVFEVDVIRRAQPLAVLGSCTDEKRRPMYPFELQALRETDALGAADG